MTGSNKKAGDEHVLSVFFTFLVILYYIAEYLELTKHPSIHIVH
jgi:hypothetical protein